MEYRLHDAPPELWAWVKSRAYLAGLTVNDYIFAILTEVKSDQDLTAKGKYNLDTRSGKKLYKL